MTLTSSHSPATVSQAGGIRHVLNELDAVNLILTEECNSKCQSCSYWLSEGRILDYAYLSNKLLPLIRLANPKVVRLTGGEPTHHPNFSQICHIFSDVASMGIVLNTHGYRLENTFPSIRDYVSAYILSLDSATAQGYLKIRGVPWFHHVIRQPQMLHNYSERIFVAFSTVIQQQNVAELTDIALLARGVGANLITFNLTAFIPGSYANKPGRIAKQERRLDISVEQLPVLEKQLASLVQLRESLSPLRILQSDQVLESYIHILRARASGHEQDIPIRKCGVPFSTVTISPDERIKPCFILPHSYSIEEPSFHNSESLLSFRSDFLKNDTLVESTCKRCYVYPYTFEDSLDELVSALGMVTT